MTLSPVKVEPEAGPSTPQTSLASRLATYAFNPPKASPGRSSKCRQVIEVVIESPRRRKGRRLATQTVDNESQGDEDASPTPGRKRRRMADRTPDLVLKNEPEWTPLRGVAPKGTSKKSPKVPRPYAGPEVYAHLHHIPDHLKPGLSIVFCGINPGKRSATDGHHFAHPSNKFWKVLHMSGITDRRVPPAEDSDMPDLYDFGLTNLCDRPTMEMSELSDLEMKLQVPQFTRKLMQYKPLVVCLVGKKIWDIYEGVVSRTAGLPTTTHPTEPSEASSSSTRLVTPKNEPLNPYLDAETHHAPPNPYLNLPPITETRGKNGVTLLSLGSPTLALRSPTSPKRVSPPTSSRGKGKGKPKQPLDWHAPRVFRLPHEEGYTYFWTTPNTSGLERTPLPEVAEMFRSLKAFANELQSGKSPPSTFRDIDIKGVEASAEHLRRGGEARGKRVSYVTRRHGTDREVNVQ